ncbi:MAG: cytochrome c oxidase assembly protein [Burkholderiales bacterium]|nr:cytochrome c oxidase assembly protein [Burkholderiales bacterium]
MVNARQAGNRQTLVRLALVSAMMFGFGYAMVPFYRALCEAIGINNVVKPDATGAAANTQVDATRTLVVEFDTNLRNDLPWTFRPAQPSVRVHPGELATVNFEIRNNSGRPVTGQAIPSYGPQVAARHFRKLECFCFTQQTLAPGEVKVMPVAFVIDRELPDDVNTVTLSYTFFEVEGRRGGEEANARGRSG